jgi:hypothetical protein
MADTGTKICMDIYRKLEKSRVLNIIEDLQILDILEIWYLYNLLWKYVKKYISIQTSTFLFVLFILKFEYFLALEKEKTTGNTDWNVGQTQTLEYRRGGWGA